MIARCETFHAEISTHQNIAGFVLGAIAHNYLFKMAAIENQWCLCLTYVCIILKLSGMHKGSLCDFEVSFWNHETNGIRKGVGTYGKTKFWYWQEVKTCWMYGRTISFISLLELQAVVRLIIHIQVTTHDGKGTGTTIT